MKNLAFFSCLWIGFCFSCLGQSMEEKVTDYLELFLTHNKGLISRSDLIETVWTATDPLGNRTLMFFENGRFKMENKGFQARTTRQKGSWYINNEFVVLRVKKEKVPIYVLKKQGKLILVDDDQVDVLKQLLTDASYKDGELKPYSYSEIFTFLNGFTIKE